MPVQSINPEINPNFELQPESDSESDFNLIPASADNDSGDLNVRRIVRSIADSPNMSRRELLKFTRDVALTGVGMGLAAGVAADATGNLPSQQIETEHPHPPVAPKLYPRIPRPSISQIPAYGPRTNPHHDER